MVARRLRLQERARPRRPGFPPDGAPEGTPPSIAANITSDKAAGIGAWTDQEIARAITKGMAATGGR